MSATSTLPNRLARMIAARDIAEDYDAWLCDVWGVIHNGVAAFPDAVDALCRYRQGGGRVILITNAPRPARAVRPQLQQLGVPDDAYDDIVTSGDVTHILVKAQADTPLFHLGPPRDHAMLEGLPNPIVGSHKAGLCLLTGALDDEKETAEDYDSRLLALLDRNVTLYCANPDLVVQRGDRLVICAGAIAQRYSELGGNVVIAGKPEAPIYQAAIEMLGAITGNQVDLNRVLAVGDGLPTDIKGAEQNGFDVYFITGGIHADEFGDLNSPEGIVQVATRTTTKFPELKIAGICDRLRWE